MTTSTYTSTWEAKTNAGFQAWGSAISAAIRACGFAATADTGQINWTTVASPTTNNAVAGYEIYAFNDTLQSTSPVYFKLSYGSGSYHASSTNGYPQLLITVGTGTDGAGNLTGVTTSANIQTMGTASAAGGITNTTTQYPTYVCGDGSYIGLVNKVGGMTVYQGAGASGPCFFLGRPTNSAGAYVGGAAILLTPDYNPPSNFWGPWVMQVLNTSGSPNVLYSNSSGYFSLIPMGITSSLISGSNFQMFPCYAYTPQVYALNWLAYGLNSETAMGNSVSGTIVGSTAQTYLMTGAASYGAAVPSLNNYSLLMKYQ